MKKLLFVFAFLAFFAVDNFGQYYIGVKGGLGLNMQKWNGYERDVLFTPSIDIFTETHDDELNKLYASFGFHTRGSALRIFRFNASNPYKFNNLVLELGGKRMVTTDKKYNGYYMIGLRAEYTMSTNLEDRNNSIYDLVSDVYVNRFNYGATVGGGFELSMGEDKVVFFELSVNPDLSKQYDQPERLTIENPFQSPIFTNPFYEIVPEEVRNVSLELKIGIKFLRGYIEYEDY